MSRLVADLGNVYRACKEPLANGSRLFWTLLGGPQFRNRFENVSTMEYAAAETRVAEIMSRLGSARMINPDLTLVHEELIFVGHMMSHASRRGAYLKGDEGRIPAAEMARDLQQIIETHRKVWLARNRPGGLSDSVGRLVSAGKAYET
jgi:hypothetical protein